MSTITKDKVETKEVILSQQSSNLSAAAQRQEVNDVEARISQSAPPAFIASPSL